MLFPQLGVRECSLEQDGAGWSGMEWDGAGWSGMEQDGAGWSGMEQHAWDHRSTRDVPICSRCGRLARG